MVSCIIFNNTRKLLSTFSLKIKLKYVRFIIFVEYKKKYKVYGIIRVIS